MEERIQKQLDLLIKRYPQLAVCRENIENAYTILE